MKFVTDKEQQAFETKFKNVLKILALGVAILIIIITAVCYGRPITINGRPLTIFENKAWDRSGNDNNGVIEGGAILGDGEITLDGVDDYVVIPTVTLNSVGHTISWWMKPDTKDVAKAIFKDNTSDNWGMGEIYQYISGDGILSQRDGSGIHVLTTELVAETYQHCCIIKSGTVQSFYLNGVLKASETATGQGNIEKIGYGTPANVPTYFAGGMANMRFYNRAITSNEMVLISADITASKDAISTNDLVAFYNFERNANPMVIE